MLELALALKRLGHRVTIACHDFLPGTEHENASREIEIRCVREGIVELPSNRLAEMRRLWLGMPKVARLVPDDVDVVNAHDPLGLRAGRIAARQRHVPLVWTRNDEAIFERAAIPDETIVGSRGIAGRLGRALFGLPSLLDARRAGAIVVLDERNARMVERSYGRPATIVRSGPANMFFERADRADARRRLGIGEDVFLAAGVAILFPHRRFEDLIEAIALVRDRLPVRACIVGSGTGDPAYAERLESLIERLGVGERVTVSRQALSDEDLKQLYAAADVFVYPNERQTWGLVPLEALASGTPAIVSSGAGVHEVLEGRPGVAIVPPRQPEAIAQALVAIEGEDRAVVEPTATWIREELNNERYAQRMAELFAQLRA